MTTPTTTSDNDARRRLRWSVYLLLMTLSTGAMLGRIAAVDSVDRVALQDSRTRQVEQKLERQRAKLRQQGLEGAALEQAVDQFARQERLWEWALVRRPFLSANDRSRWATVRALVEEDMRVPGHPYAIDKVLQEPNWDTIDMVKHNGHLYSSKPPLLPTLLAGEYWVIRQVTSLGGAPPASLGPEPYWVGRIMLATANVIPMLIYFLAIAGLIERLGTSDWGRIFVMGVAAFGTFLTTFAVTINNHLPAAVCAAATLYLVVRIWFDGRRHWGLFALAGLAAALTATNELPALSLFAAVSLALLWKAPWQTLLAYVPAAALVAAAFFGTTWLAFGGLTLPYLHGGQMVLLPVDAKFEQSVARAVDRAVETNAEDNGANASTEDSTGRSPREIVDAVLVSIDQDTFQQAVVRSGRTAVIEAVCKAVAHVVPGATDQPGVRAAIVRAAEEADVAADRPDNWYDYAYRSNGRYVASYWRNPKGMDLTRDPPGVYALHALVGHHGIFSLTPVWLLSIVGMLLGLWHGRPWPMRHVALLVAAVSLVCLAFYLNPNGSQRNYGGLTSGLRWMFWFAPLWLVVMLPAADAMARRWWAQLVALLLLAASVFSASYPTWNPWSQPWIMDYLTYLGWLG